MKSANMSYTLLTLVLGFSFLIHLPAAYAGEPLFGYVYTTDTTPEGHYEIEEWITDRAGQAQGRFNHVHFSNEVEFGVSDRFQIAVYANFMYDNDSGNSVRGQTEGIEIPADHDPNSPYESFRFDSLALELLYRMLSPYNDPVGLAFYAEPEFGPRGGGLEFRGIVQKNLLEDQLVLALNTWVEFELEEGSNLVSPGDTDAPDGKYSKATMLEADLGASYRFASNWFIGLEFRNHNEYQGYSVSHSNQDHTAFFLGPDIHYAAEKWFVTVSALRQIGAIAFKDEQQAQMKDGLLYGDEHTTWDGLRLKVGFPF